MTAKTTGDMYKQRLNRLVGILVCALMAVVIIAGCSIDQPQKPRPRQRSMEASPMEAYRPGPDSPPSGAPDGRPGYGPGDGNMPPLLPMDGFRMRMKPLAECTVLVVQSYHPEYAWVRELSAGIRRKLDPAGVHFETFYMDTKRRTDEDWKKRAGDSAVAVVLRLKPDVVIACDDNAQEYFAGRFVDSSLPIVFCGVNADPARYGYPSRNITGIIERPHLDSTVKFAQELFPIRRIALLSSDDPTSVAALNFLRQQMHAVIVTDYRLVHDFTEWKQVIVELNDKVDAIGIYMYHTLTDSGSEESLPPEKVMAWTTAHVTVPTLGFFDFGIRDGLLLGVTESGEENGERAAQYVLEILRGTPPSVLPVVKAELGTRMLNRRTAHELGFETAAAGLDNVRLAAGE